MSQTSIDQSLIMFMNSNHLLGQLIRILYEKSKHAKLSKVKTKFAKKTKNFYFYYYRITHNVIYY